MQDDLLVVGLNLETGREVHVSDAGREYWYARGYSGRRTLVCALCYAGIDAEPGTRVPLVIRSKTGGQRRPHFAHPPGQVPAGGHHPESLWHLTVKAVLAAWGRRQPGVADVTAEQRTPDRARRCDVRVRFRDGRQVALEAQASPLTDREWSARHADYQRQGITDIWLWHPRPRPHWAVASHGQSLWELDPGEQRAYLLLGAAHDRPAHWWTRKDLHLYALHEPPCVGDTLQRRDLALSTIGLTADGLVIPDPVHHEIEKARTAVREAAQQTRATRNSRRRPQPGNRPASSPDPRPNQPAPSGPQPASTARPGKLACMTCGLPLDPILARIGRHIGC